MRGLQTYNSSTIETQKCRCSAELFIQNHQKQRQHHHYYAELFTLCLVATINLRVHYQDVMQLHK